MAQNRSKRSQYGWVCHLSKWRRGGELQLTSKETRETTSIITEFNIRRGCNYTNQEPLRSEGMVTMVMFFSQLVTGLESNHVQSIFPARLVLKCQRLEGPETFAESMRANGKWYLWNASSCAPHLFWRCSCSQGMCQIDPNSKWGAGSGSSMYLQYMLQVQVASKSARHVWHSCTLYTVEISMKLCHFVWYSNYSTCFFCLSTHRLPWECNQVSR